LGLSGSEVTLPPITVRIGDTPSMPRHKPKQVSFETMSDGSTRANAKSKSPETFSLAWAQLTAAELATIETEIARNVRLHYQNAWHSTTWYWVMVAEWEVDPVVYLGTVLYSARLELQEVGP
jgi:hypothetical protein